MLTVIFDKGLTDFAGSGKSEGEREAALLLVSFFSTDQRLVAVLAGVLQLVVLVVFDAYAWYCTQELKERRLAPSPLWPLLLLMLLLRVPLTIAVERQCAP